MSRKGRYYGRRKRYYRSYYGRQDYGLVGFGLSYYILMAMVVTIPIALAYYFFKIIILFSIPLLSIALIIFIKKFDIRTITNVNVTSSLQKFLLILDAMLYKNVVSIVLTISSFWYVVYWYGKLIDILFNHYLEMKSIYVMKLIMLFDYSYIDFEIIKVILFHIVYILSFLFLTFLFLVSIFVIAKQTFRFFSIAENLLDYIINPICIRVIKTISLIIFIVLLLNYPISILTDNYIFFDELVSDFINYILW